MVKLVFIDDPVYYHDSSSLCNSINYGINETQNNIAFHLKIISSKECRSFLNNYHYINKEGGGFRSGINYGLIINNIISGVCIYHAISGFHTKKGMLMENHQDKCVFEMGRLCIKPFLNIKNILSKFVSLTFKDLKKNHNHIDYILTYADSQFHSGKIYQALSMNYYGITAKKKDFWFDLGNGVFKKQRKGEVKNKKGVWLNRTQKYRYVKVLKKNYDKYIIWKKQPYNNIEFRKQIFN